jgi:hypothetical protein
MPSIEKLVVDDHFVGVLLEEMSFASGETQDVEKVEHEQLKC